MMRSLRSLGEIEKVAVRRKAPNCPCNPHRRLFQTSIHAS